MQVVVVILALALLAVVLYVIGAPLRQNRDDEAEQSPERDELEVAREAKYREIRDAELDMRTGKLSHADYEAVDGALRAEALQILDRLHALPGDDPAEPPRQSEDAQSEGAGP